MPLVSVVNSKGGQGKTTYACALAGFLAHHGHGGELLDCDPQQGDAKSWADEILHPARLVDQTGKPLVAIMQAASEDARWHVADLLPHEGETMRVAMALSHSILVPVAIGGQDIRGWSRLNSLIHETRQNINPALRVGLVANAVRQGTDLTKNYLPHLTALHDPANSIWVLGQVGLRTAIGEAYVRAEHIWAQNSPAGEEVRIILEKFAKNVICVKM